MSEREWHELSAEEVAREQQVDPGVGLDATQIDERRARFGSNVLPEAQRTSLLRVFLHQFQSPLIYILFVAAVFAFAFGKRGDAFVILLVVVVNALIGTLQEGRAERSMNALRQLAALKVRVLRGRLEQTIEARELVPGDVLLLAAGDAVGADARIVSAATVEAAEAALTGESLPVPKSVTPLACETALADRSNMVYSGTLITSGRGKAIVVATALQTEVGNISQLTQSARDADTPLEQRVAQFSRYVAAGALVLFTAVMAFGVLRGMPLADIFMVAISQMVSMVPEGLPVAMTVGLAVGMQRMARSGAIVRRLAAVETLGSTSVICSDKTGTLTRNEMTVTALWLADERELVISGAGYAPEGFIEYESQRLDAANDDSLKIIAEAVALCNDAELVPPDDVDARWRVLGDPTEAALLTLARKAQINIEALRNTWPRRAEIPFSAENKLMATQHVNTTGTKRLIIKGAPETILDLCVQRRYGTETKPIDTEYRALALAAAERLANRALRVLAVAEIDDAEIDANGGVAQLNGRATLLALVGQMDPPREEVKVAVAECQQAGIRVVMVTGDHKATGLAVAQILGIAGPTDSAVSGPELESMSEPELAANLHRIAVFARVHPAQKLRIVEACQHKQLVVAMTGDGVNDAPALASADVGVAMGITGTEIAKSAAKIILTDDNFATIVKAVAEGRLVYRNLKKVILYLFATSMAEVLVLLVALLAGYPLPLAAVQILWINLVTEGTVTVNLIMEPMEGDEMRRPPMKLSEPLLNAALLKRMALMTPSIAISTLGYFIWRLSTDVPFAVVQTETFTVLAVCQWFNVLNCESETKSAFTLRVLRNKWLLAGLIVSISLQIAVLYVPVLNTLFHTVPIPPQDIMLVVTAASLVLWVEEARKWVARRKLARGG